jgi:outer membrane protein assembly factor BamE (lipoprotein component of BamABCDE complex)
MRRLAAMGLILLASACHSVGPDLTMGEIAQIRAGVTRKAEVERMLGAPSTREVMPGGEEMWQYVSLRTGVISSSAGTAEIYFRGDVVSRCAVNHNNSGYVGVGSGRSQSDCGEAPSLAPARPAKKRG